VAGHAVQEVRPAAAGPAQGVGLFVTGVGVLLGFFGVLPAVPIAAAVAFVAAALNAVVGLCLGCEMYLLMRRAGLVRA
jgi:hypothetical protein